MPGQLFTHYFLTDGIRTTPEWKSSSSGTAEFRSKLATLYENIQKYHQPNEAVTEDDFIIPVLELLGWSDHLPQQSSGRSEDIPDYLLFADVQYKARAAARTNPEDRYMDATTVVRKQTLRPATGQQGQERRISKEHTPRPDTTLPFSGRHRLRRQHPVGYPDQRRPMAPV